MTAELDPLLDESADDDTEEALVSFDFDSLYSFID